jgi:hypothetical protein
MNYEKDNHDSEDFANRSNKEVKTVFTEFNMATYFNMNFNPNFNFNFKIETSSAANSLA